MCAALKRDVCLSVWCGYSIPAAERLDSFAVSIVQLAHAVDESILCRKGFGEELLVMIL